jgi:hypothetical protein
MKTLYLSIIIGLCVTITVTSFLFVVEITRPSNVFHSSSEEQTVMHTTGLQCENEFKPKPFEIKVLPNGTSLTINYIPVFLMKPNSTGKVCINNWPVDKTFGYTGKTSAGVGNGNSQTFDITVIPYPSEITIDSTSNKTIVYTITTSSQAHGFYRVSPMFDNCAGGIPLAIGYNSSHLFDKDFPWLWETYPCPFGGINTQIIGLTGIDVAYITKVY